MDSYCQVTLGFKERLAPEDFLGCLAFLDPQDLLVPRETEESRETGARLEWGWKVRWVLRDLTDCRVLQVLESQVSRGCGVLLASKVGESVRVAAWCDAFQEFQEWQEPAVPLDRRDTARTRDTLATAGGRKTKRGRKILSND